MVIAMENNKGEKVSFHPHFLSLGIFIAIGSFAGHAIGKSEEIEFNLDVLDSEDRQNVDLSNFSHSGYIMPGEYEMAVFLNKSSLSQQRVVFYQPQANPKESEVCLSPGLIDLFGLKPEYLRQLSWQVGKKCLRVDSLPGTEIRADLAQNSVYISMPQTYLEYSAENWDPPSRWDNGLPGILLDYNLNGRAQSNRQGGADAYTLSGNGTTGINYGAWRIRADWQATIAPTPQGQNASQNPFQWSRYYAYRAITSLRSRLTLGENYLDSGMFDSFRYTGASLVSDDSMLPPNLRGYAPEVTGVAKTNATVVVSQQGRVLYETQVASGPFRIQDISDATTGQLDVRVEEQDGSVQTFTLNTANIPYLTRPGSVRYKLAVGRPSDIDSGVSDSVFASGEFSWGVSNGWSLYGGLLGSNDYAAISSGVGRDLMMFGALSFDATQSRATLPWQAETLSGRSYRLSYSKRFDELDSQVTFAGYRFSEREFMSMSDYLTAKRNGDYTRGSKELYTISLNKSFRDLGLSGYLSYNHQTYWNLTNSDRYSLLLSSFFDIGRWRNISASMSLYRNKNNNTSDDGAYISLSVPWGRQGRISYSSTANSNDTTHYLGYYDRLNERDTYQLSAGTARSGVNGSGFLTHEGDRARLTANASYQQGRYSSLALSAQGGITLTSQGGALHRGGINGGTRMLVDTNGVAGVPVQAGGRSTRTNMFGKAVVAEIASFYPSKVRIDLDNLGDNAEAKTSVVQGTLTEGAIGYRKFEVLGGNRAMAVIRLADGSTPPFGATVSNAYKQETGIVTNEGDVYLSGVNPGEKMTVRWNGGEECEIHLPQALPEELLSQSLLLPCAKS
ncbi:Outer membrane usher protein papC precursor [Cedecea davisae]|uniref:Putative outer membrane usher protein PapC n=2 Tax=Cedecea davisae TaxID=158484 RepID=S3JYA0_9ENTR|nr:putative outer membrane usher protein PapC [Cedecea davisae DSM 4568]SUX28303.1 Outer membrane usher protein papC precursor [Cedecea davisae]